MIVGLRSPKISLIGRFDQFYHRNRRPKDGLLLQQMLNLIGLLEKGWRLGAVGTAGIQNQIQGHHPAKMFFEETQIPVNMIVPWQIIDNVTVGP